MGIAARRRAGLPRLLHGGSVPQTVDPARGLSYLKGVSKLDIITLPDRRLRTASAPVERIDDDVRRFLDDMLETMYEAPGIGLAAVQVGVPRRMVTVDVAKREDEDAEPNPLFLINPEILWSSDERAVHEEGCLSIPEYYAEVERPASVRVRYLDRDGKLQEIEANSILAVCLQHEIDHLNGTLFIDHLSKLKRDRARAIMAGDTETGVMVMRMEAGLDTGPVAMGERVPIGPDMTAGELSERLARLGADLMARALSALSRGVLDTRPQPAEGVTYASKIDKSETRIDWSRAAAEVHNHIRGLSPIRARLETEFGKGPERVKVLRSTRADGSGAAGRVLDADLTVACGSGAVRLVELQRAGRQPVKAAEFLRGLRLGPGQRLRDERRIAGRGAGRPGRLGHGLDFVQVRRDRNGRSPWSRSSTEMTVGSTR